MAAQKCLYINLGQLCASQIFIFLKVDNLYVIEEKKCGGSRDVVFANTDEQQKLMFGK